MGLRFADLLGRPRGFQGGIFLPARRERTAGLPVQPFANPRLLHVPLDQINDSPATACVQPGEMVEAGQLIGRAESTAGVHVHAPLAGRIAGLLRIDTARRSDVAAAAIEVREQPPREYRPVQLPERMQEPSLDDFLHAAEAAGLTDLQPRPASLGFVLRKAARSGVRHLIVNTLRGEPMLTDSALLAEEHLETIVRVADWLGAALGARRRWLAVDRADRPAISRARIVATGTSVRLANLVNKYPQHAAALLAASVTRRETPPGKSTLDVGVIVVEAEALVSLAAALSWPDYAGMPMTHRVVTVSGPGVLRPGHYLVPLGTRFCDVLHQVGVAGTIRRVVDGGPLTGRAVDNLNVVTSKQTSAILVLDRTGDRVPSPGPCVCCGWCQEDCPVGLDPQILLNIVERGEFDQAAAYHPQACIECGLCSYVCPAELPLAQAASMLKNGRCRPEI